jgi:hypothetical protein
MCLATACDIRIAAQDAKLGYNFATLGVHPGLAATHYLPQLVGAQVSARLLLTGEVCCRGGGWGWGRDRGLILYSPPQNPNSWCWARKRLASDW